MNFAIANLKGGVGKTTTAICLAGIWAAQGRRALVVDLDSQGSASRWLADKSAAMRNVLDGKPIIDQIAPTCVDGLDVLASDARLVTKHPSTDVFRRGLAELDYDAVFFDCPPQLGEFAVLGMSMATDLLIPLEPGFLSLDSLSRILSVVERIRSSAEEYGNPDLRINGVILCKWDSRENLSERFRNELDGRLDALDTRLLPTVRRNVRVAEAPEHGLPVEQYAPESIGAQDYRKVAATLNQEFENE